VLVPAVVAVWLPGAAPAAGNGSFRVSYGPPLSGYAPQGNPDSPQKPLAITVTAVGPDGKAVQNALIDATLTAPQFGPVIGSDVPRIEGHKLVHLRLGAPTGRATFKIVLPIRGSYHLDLAARPALGAGFQPFSQRVAFPVKERSGELAKLIAVLIALFAFGAAAAVLLTRSQLARRERVAAAGQAEARRAPPSQASRLASTLLIALALGVVALLAVDAASDSAVNKKVLGYKGPGKGERASTSAGRYELVASLSRSTGDGVGTATLVGIRGQLVDKRSGAPVRGAAFRLEALDKESGKPALAADTTSPDGSFVWDHDFWDGVDYDVRVTASRGDSKARFKPVAASIGLGVQSISPPLGRKLVGLALLLAAVALGMVLGVVVAKRRWRPKPAVRAEGQVLRGGAR
jgi:hypothetical protein